VQIEREFTRHSNGATPAPNYLRWRRVVPTLAAITAIAVCVVAGNWQRGRMEEKEQLSAQAAAAAHIAPAPLPAGDVDWAAWRFRPVTATGVFDAARQILIDNKVRAGVVGFDVVTPLALPDGRVVLVDRGFVPVGRSRSVLPEAPPPAGQITVRGRIDIPASGYFELGKEQAQGPLRQHLDPRRFAVATGLPVLPIVIEATAGTGNDDALVRDRPAPDFGGERNRIYMVQWYAFAALAAGLWLWFTFRPRRAGA